MQTRPKPLKKNCRAENINGITILIDYTGGKDAIIYIRGGSHNLDTMWSDFTFSLKNDLLIDLPAFYFLTYPVAQIAGGRYSRV